MKHVIRPANDTDAGRIAEIYNPFVLDTIVSFEESAVSVDAMLERMRSVQATHPWYVFEDEAAVQGFAYAAPFHARPAYRYTVETTIYVDPAYQGRGAGAALYERLIGDLRESGTRSAVGLIALPNPGSVALHERFGFEHVGTLRSVGRKHDRWVDVGFWQLMIG